MPGVLFMPRVRRSFSPEFKARVVLDLLTGAVSQAELLRKYNLKAPLLAQWRDSVLERLPSLFQADDHADQSQLRIAELERLVGRQAYELEALKKASRLLTGPPSRDGRSS